MTKISPLEPGSELYEEAILDSSLLVYRGIKPESFKEILHETGHQAVVELHDGCHRIKSSSNGTSFYITLRSYDEGLKSYRQFSLSAKYSSNKGLVAGTQLMNRFNTLCSFVKGVVGDNGDLEVRMDCLIGKGVTVDQIAQWLDLWRASLVVFEEYWAELDNELGP
jgi:hypothetical protein